MKKKWKLILGLAVVLIAAGGLIAFQAPWELEVEVREVAPGNIKRSFSEEGHVKPTTERDIYAQHSAIVDELLVEEGQTVSEGQLLAVLDDSELDYAMRELDAQLKALEGERMQLEEEPGPAELESYELSVAEAEESLAAAERNLERVERLYVEGYELRVGEAKQALDSAKQHYERTKNLYENDIISRVEYEKAKEQVEIAENQLAQQEHALEVFEEVEYDQAEEHVRKAEHNLALQEKAREVLHESYDPPRGSREIIEARREAILAQKDLLSYQKTHYRLEAPVSGVITGINTEKGKMASPQAPLMSLFQPEEYKVETRVLTRDIYDITEGMTVTLVLEKRDEKIPFPGEVKTISSYAEKDQSPLGLEEERVKITIIPQLPEGLQVAPGYKLDVEFTTEKLQDVLTIPKASLFHYEGDDALFVVEDKRLRIHRVNTGLETRQEAVITEGLEEGDLVVLDPRQGDIDEGARVSPIIVNDSGQ